MEEVLEDIRALLLIERAKMHRRITPKTPEDEIEEQVGSDGERSRLRKWEPALRSALDEIADVRKLINSHRQET
jgi:hypothetical protein